MLVSEVLLLVLVMGMSGGAEENEVGGYFNLLKGH
jgi:hypothetical protein